MRSLSFAVLSGVIVVGFGLDLWAWRTVQAAETVAAQSLVDRATTPASADQKGAFDREGEERLFKIQESVLKAVEQSNTKTKEEFDFAILAVGFVGTMVLAVF